MQLLPIITNNWEKICFEYEIWVICWRRSQSFSRSRRPGASLDGHLLELDWQHAFTIQCGELTPPSSSVDRCVAFVSSSHPCHRHFLILCSRQMPALLEQSCIPKANLNRIYNNRIISTSLIFLKNIRYSARDDSETWHERSPLRRASPVDGSDPAGRRWE